jgi:hypothetical protein
LDGWPHARSNEEGSHGHGPEGNIWSEIKYTNELLKHLTGQINQTPRSCSYGDPVAVYDPSSVGRKRAIIEVGAGEADRCPSWWSP